LNLQHLNWGSADAQPVTYSFDIYSTIASTYVVELYRAETTARVISALLPVPAGWSTQSVTFPGDTAAGITNDNLGRLQVTVWLAAGSNYTSGTLQTAWGNVVQTNRAVGLSNAIQATVNQVFALTNCQFEVGSAPTPYEVLRYDVDLARCQRYAFYPGKDIPTANYVVLGGGMATATTSVASLFWLPVAMRTAPTWDLNGTAATIYGLHDRIGTAGAVSAIAQDVVSTPTVAALQSTCNAVLTVGRYYQMLRNSGQAGCGGWTADI